MRRSSALVLQLWFRYVAVCLRVDPRSTVALAPPLEDELVEPYASIHVLATFSDTSTAFSRKASAVLSALYNMPPYLSRMQSPNAASRVAAVANSKGRDDG